MISTSIFAAESASSVQSARQALEQTRQTQNEILGALSGLTTGRQQAASGGELLNGLATVLQMQTAVVRTTRALVAKTFGAAADKLPQEDRQAIEQLAGDQRAVRQRLADWMTSFTQIAAGDSGTDALRAVQSRVTACPAGELMEQAVRHAGGNRLAEASTSGQQAVDELIRLLELLEVATIDPADLRDQRLRQLREIIQQEKAIGGKLDPAPAGAVEWRRLQREQSEVSERTRPFTFDETGLPPDVLQLLRQGHQSMRAAESALRSQQRDPAAQAVEQSIKFLGDALPLIEAAGGEKDPDLPAVPLTKQKPGQAIVGGSMVAGGGSPADDQSPIGQVAADIALVVKLRRAQKELYEETTHKRPARAGAAERQTSCAGQLPQLIHRVENYHAPAAADLDQARRAMVDAVTPLRSNDEQSAVARQHTALDALAAAETKLRTFWNELFEAMARITTMGGAAMAQGGGPQGKQEKVNMDLLLTMLREIVRVGQLMKDQDALIAITKGWVENATSKPDKSAVAEAIKKQKQLFDTARDIHEKLLPVASEAQGLPDAVLEASEFMDGAANALAVPKFNRALERQEGAIESLERAWTVMSASVASMTQAMQSSQGATDTSAGQPETGQNAGGGTDAADAGKPWYWNLPPQARDAVSQSMDEAFPAQYAPAIKRYYERLSKQHGK